MVEAGAHWLSSNVLKASLLHCGKISGGWNLEICCAFIDDMSGAPATMSIRGPVRHLGVVERGSQADMKK